MKFIPLFFLCVKIFSFMNSGPIYYFLGNIKGIMKDKLDNPQLKQVIYVDKSARIFLIYMALNILFLCYCVYLMFTPATWNEGCLLLFISAWESFAVQGKIDGACFTDQHGIVYPRIWVRYLCCGSTFYILLQLFYTA